MDWNANLEAGLIVAAVVAGLYLLYGILVKLGEIAKLLGRTRDRE